MYGIGGVAVIGIIAYLYNKKKKDDALKMATTATPPPSMETIIDMGGMNPTLLEDSMVVMPDGSIVDGSLIAVETNPTSMVAVDPTRVPVETNPFTINEPIKIPPVYDLIDSKFQAELLSTAPARFDGGFANAGGRGKVRRKMLKFDGGFDYADGYGCSLDPVLGM